MLVNFFLIRKFPPISYINHYSFCCPPFVCCFFISIFVRPPTSRGSILVLATVTLKPTEEKSIQCWLNCLYVFHFYLSITLFIYKFIFTNIEFILQYLRNLFFVLFVDFNICKIMNVINHIFYNVLHFFLNLM